ncbi:MAG TPA: HAD-IB family hydrolase [Acidimicrobiales bacterium]|nr:HAD-IB family hydrolase [Acidimicrobiales bacterium]
MTTAPTPLVPAPGPAGDRPTVAAFDFDGTLTHGGSVLAFLVAVRGPLPTAVAVLRSLPGLIRSALFSGSAADDTKEGLFTDLLSGLPAQEVDRLAADFAERHLRRRLRRDARDRLDWHRKQGHRVVVVSASPDLYVRPAADLLGAEAALATRLAVSGHLLTGRYEGKNCRGPEKYARLAGWLRAEGLNGAGPNAPVLWVYGNSRGDLRLLQAADHGVDAGRLGRFGRLRRYPRLATVMAEAPPA